MDIDQKGWLIPAIAGWNVAFMRAPRRSWWDWLTHPDFRHVCAYGYDGQTETWVVIDPVETHIQVRLLNDTSFAAWQIETSAATSWVLRVPVAQDRFAARSRIGLWCTTVVANLLGVRSGAFRPQALFRDLLAAGAEVARDPDAGDEEGRRER